MLLLTSTSDIVRIVTGSAATVNVHASVMDNASGTITPVRINTATISTATTTTVVASPASSTQRNVKNLSVHNVHASTATTVDVQHFDGTNSESLWSANLLPGEAVVFDETGGWSHYDASGNPYVSGLPVTTKGDVLVYSTQPDRLAVGSAGSVIIADSTATPGVRWVQRTLTNRSTSTVSAGYASDTYLAGSSLAVPSNGPIVGTSFRWIFDMVKTAAGTATLAINIRYGTAGTTSDTSRVAFTFAAGTAAADTGFFEVNAHFRTVGSGTSAVLVGLCTCSHALAATGLISTGASGVGQLVTVSSGFDSTPANSIIGLSVNGGASFSGTCTLVEAYGWNLNG